MRGIPGHGEHLVGGIPLEQIGVTKHLPAVERRIVGEILGDDSGASARGGKNKQAGDGQRTDFFHGTDLSFWFREKIRGTVLVERPAWKKGC